MKKLNQLIRVQAVCIGNGILKVDSFINHQILPDLTYEMGHEFHTRLLELNVSAPTKILTAEVSGIASALAAAQAFDVPLIFARKKKPITMTDGYFEEEAISPTKTESVKLRVSKEFLKPEDSVIIIDDFLASARTVNALARIVKSSGAGLLAVGCIIEKVYSGGREKLKQLNVPVITLAQVDVINNQIIIVEE